LNSAELFQEKMPVVPLAGVELRSQVIDYAGEC